MRRTCDQCGVEFTKTSNNQRFCSKTCRVNHFDSYEKRRTEYVKRPKKKYSPGQVTCLRCQRVFKSWDIKLNRICGMCKPYIQDYSTGVETFILETATSFY